MYDDHPSFRANFSHTHACTRASYALQAKPNLSDDAPELQEYTSKLHELREQLARVKEGGEELQEEPYYPVRGSRGRGRGGRALAGGRGRGRSSRGRGRGRAALTGQSIDNRPKTIVITSPPESFGVRCPSL